MSDTGIYYRCEECGTLSASPLTYVTVTTWKEEWGQWTSTHIAICSRCKADADACCDDLLSTAGAGTD